MQIIQILNDFIKVLYSPEYEGVCITDFILIKDLKNCYLGQVVEVCDDKFDNEKNIAKIKITHSINEQGKVSNYTKQITNKHAEVLFANQREVYNFINHNSSVIKIGEDIKYSRELELNLKFFENKPVIFCDKFAEYTYIATELGKKLSNYDNVVIFDYTGGINIKTAVNLKAGLDFKLPLNYVTLDSIWRKGLAGSPLEIQALLGEIFNEVKNYAKNTKDKYIPFNKFLKVILEQYKATPLKELLILKNRLIKYQQEEIFANNKTEFKSLSKKISSSRVTIIDMSLLKNEWQKDYTELVLRSIKNESYVFIRINQNNYSADLCNYMMSPKRKFKIIPSISHSFSKLPLITENSFNSIVAQSLNIKKEFGYFGDIIANLDKKTYLFLGDDTKDFALIVKNLEVEQKGTIQAPDIVDEKITLEGDIIKNKRVKEKIDNLKEQKSKEISDIVDEFLYNKKDESTQDAEDDLQTKKIKMANLKNKIQSGKEQNEYSEITEESLSEEVKVSEDKITEDEPKDLNAEDFSFEEIISEDELDLFENNIEENIEENEDTTTDKDAEEIESTEENTDKEIDESNDVFSAEFLDALDEINPNQINKEVNNNIEESNFEEIKINSEEKDEIEELVNQSIESTFDNILNEENEDIKTDDDTKINNGVQENNDTQDEKQDTQEENTDGISKDDIDENSLNEDIFEEIPEQEENEEFHFENIDKLDTEESDESNIKVEENKEENITAQEEVLPEVAPDLYDREEDEFNVMNEIEEGVSSTSYSLEEIGLDGETENIEEIVNEDNNANKTEEQIKQNNDFFSENDEVVHPKYGTGKVLQVIEYSNKTLLQIDFSQIGKRLLDPEVAGIKKV